MSKGLECMVLAHRRELLLSVYWHDQGQSLRARGGREPHQCENSSLVRPLSLAPGANQMVPVSGWKWYKERRIKAIVLVLCSAALQMKLINC